MQCIFPKSRTFEILITFLDDTKKHFKIPVKQKGSAVLISIANSIPVHHKEYFGLKYLDRFHKPHWINLEKTVYHQLKKSQINKSFDLSSEPFFNVEFEVRYYPRDPTSVDDENFRYQLFLQIRKDLSSMKLVIKDEAILSTLCSLILQSDFGDFTANRFAPHYVRQTISPHLLNPYLEDKIKAEHLKLRGIEPIEAEYRFLEKVRWLENYGTIIYPVKDNNNRYCFFGLTPQGFSLRYPKESHLNYEIFWPRISAIRRKGRQIIVKEKTDISKKHYFETGEKILCLSLYKLSLDHFAFFKLKKDEKPLVTEPPKRSCGRSASKEFGYSSDTSDYNQYSDDTFSSYPDSINTTQSSRTTKGFHKTNVSSRNCVSDAEESALSRKKRRVIVSKSQTETEDEGFRPFDLSVKNNTFDFSVHTNEIRKPSISQSQSYDRIPPDYIYENSLSKFKAQSNEPIKQKRMRKKVSNQHNVEKKIRGQNESNNDSTATFPVKPTDNRMDRFQITDPKFTNSDTWQIKRKSGEFIEERLIKTQRKLPLPNALPQSFDSSKKNDISSSDYRIKQSASVDSISTVKNEDNRLSPTKRMLPNLSTIVPSNHAINPPVPRHRIQPKLPLDQNNSSKSQSVYADIWFKPAYPNPPPHVPQHSNVIRRVANSQSNLPEKPLPFRNYRRLSSNQLRTKPESGI